MALHGDSDGLCNIEGSRLLKREALVEDKELVEFSGIILILASINRMNSFNSNYLFRILFLDILLLNNCFLQILKFIRMFRCRTQPFYGTSTCKKLDSYRMC